MSFFQTRVGTLFRLYITLLLIFVTQKVVFMLVNIGMAGGAPLTSCMAAIWHGLRLDSVMACYLLVIPTLVLAISFFFKRFELRKILMPYYIVAAILMSVVFIADTMLYLFWGAKLDANDLIYAANPKEMLASLPWWAVVAALAVVALVAWHYVRRMRHATPEKVTKPRSQWLSLLILPVMTLLVLGMRGSVKESTANPSFAYFSTHPFCNHAALNPAFNMMHSLFKVQDIETEFNALPEEVVAAYMADAFAPDARITDTLLTTDRPNILIIVWESGGTGMVMNDTVGPCTMALAREGVYFTNCIANNFRTDRGLVSLFSGWQGLPTTSLMKRTDLCRNLPSIASTLHDNDYATYYTYGGDINFTNKRLYLVETGFTNVRGDQYFPARESTSSWGVPDGRLLRTDIIPTERPFLAVAQTLSSHEPWDVPMQRLTDPKPNAFAYTDSCIGALIDSLRLMPVWDSLLVVIVPDHGVTYGDAHSSSLPEVAHIPLIWVGGAVKEAREIDILMNQSDFAATLLAQMGIDSRELVFSRNVLAPTYLTRSPQPFAMHAYKNGLNLFTADGICSYDCVSHTLTPADKDKQKFIEALLQKIYGTSARLARR
ncbi:MAG: LTA synthase family protein [Bacteroidales bacterium]|nr:LTA synthase family protein [Bacteroidales bacterium]